MCKLVLYSKTYAENVAADCEKNGIEVRVGCPLMLYTGGPCALHALFGSVSGERKK